jgi:hypothetical protein
MQKQIAIAMLFVTAFVLIGGSFGSAALAIKHKDTVVDNAKAIVVTTSAGTTVFNINSVPGAKGDTGAAGAVGAAGANGTNGKDGAAGAQGVAGANGTQGAPGPKGDQGIPGVAGRDGTNGTNGKDGVSTICIVTGNQTCGLPGPTPTPVPVTNGTGNVTHAQHK